MFSVGTKFNSFEDLQNAIKQLEELTFCNFYKYQARTLENIKSRITKTINASLKYYEITYNCIYNCKKKSKSCGNRKKPSLIGNCPVFISLRTSVDGLTLDVRSCILIHNHETNKIIYNNLPRQRKIDLNDPTLIELLSLGANKKLVQSKIHNETGKNVRLKSLHNMKSKQTNFINNMDVLEKILKNDYNCFVKVLYDKHSVVNGIFFADDKMKNFLNSYPEIIFVDATYKLLNSR